MQIRNPGFDIDKPRARVIAERLHATPARLDRPVLVLSGWRSPYVSAWAAQRRLRPMTGARPQDFLCVSYAGSSSVERAADAALARVRTRFGPAEPVDVVGISMGGLVARLLAARGDMTIHRLFTLSTPHRGARLAEVVAVDRAARSMRAHSPMLRQLDEALARASYTLTCYALLRDWWVGATRTAPPGHEPHWLDAEGVIARVVSHFEITTDIRVLTDLALRLRGEQPISKRPSTPPAD